MGDNCYLNFVQFAMDDFERHFYLYYFNDLNQSPRIHTKFKYSSADTVRYKNLRNNFSGQNAVRQHKEFK